MERRRSPIQYTRADPRDPRDARESLKDPRLAMRDERRPPPAFREYRDPRDVREYRDVREARDGRDGRDEREYRDPREARDPRDPRDPRAFRDPRDPREMVERRRPRSDSPPQRYARSRGRTPPAAPAPKRYRREEDYDDRYERPASPPHRREFNERELYKSDPRAGPPRQRAPEETKEQRPLTFKEFMLRDLEDDVPPDVAQKRYQDYLAEYYGGQLRAEFELKKNDEGLRAKYDPRMFERAVARRNEEAKDSVSKFIAEQQAGRLNPAAEGFNQGAQNLPAALSDKKEGAQAMDSEEKSSTVKEAASAPALCWRPARVGSDLKIATQLMKKLDEEKCITNNPINQARVAEDGTPLPSTEEDVPSLDDSNVQAFLGKLDVILEYLWRVHGLDYYGGRELTEQEFAQRTTTCRTLRCPCPEDGEQPDAAEEKKASAELTRKVDSTWKKRLEEGDPAELRCQRQKVADLVEKWVESQIIMYSETKWGCRLSSKLFLGRQFVVKHIKLKHESVVLAEKEKLMEQLYFENFKEAREEEKKKAAAEQRAKMAAVAQQRRVGVPPPAPPPRHRAELPPDQLAYEAPYDGGFEEEFEPAYDGPYEELPPEGPFEVAYEDDPYMDGMEVEEGVPYGYPPRMRGRGPRGARPWGPRGRPLRPMMEAMMPMPMAPMFVPAPGAGPMGPFIMTRMPSGPPGPLLLEDGRPFPMRGRGRGLRGRGRMPFPGMIAPPGAKLDPAGIREYHDLDAPQNNRAVLDYGDL